MYHMFQCLDVCCSTYNYLFLSSTVATESTHDND